MSSENNSSNVHRHRGVRVSHSLVLNHASSQFEVVSWDGRRHNKIQHSQLQIHTKIVMMILLCEQCYLYTWY